MLYLNPNILIEKLTEDFSLIVNLLSPQKIKLLNKKQLDVVNSIKEHNGFLSDNKGELFQFLNQLKEQGIINSTGLFNFDYSLNTKLKNINLWIHTTDLCNLNCKYCYIKSKPNKLTLDQKNKNQILRKICETVSINNLEEVTLRLAGGEPLIFFDDWKSFIVTLKNKLSELNCKLRTVFLTNLTLFPDNFIDFVKETGSIVNVSMDGLNEFHDKSRAFGNGQSSFHYVKENLFKLVENGIKPSIMTVISDDNIDGIFDFCKWVVKYEFPFRFSIVHDMSFDQGKLLNELLRCYDYIEAEIKKGYSFSQLHKLCDLKFDYFSNKNCYSGINSAAIYCDGNIYFCQRTIGMHSPSDSIFSEKDLFSMINKNKVDKFLSDECNKCKYRFICNGGCPLNRINGKSPACDLYKKIIPVIYRLIGLERLQYIYNVLKN